MRKSLNLNPAVGIDHGLHRYHGWRDSRGDEPLCTVHPPGGSVAEPSPSRQPTMCFRYHRVQKGESCHENES